MQRGWLVTAACWLLVAPVMAQPLDEDALPDGAQTRLGSRQRRWRPVLAHAFIDEGRTLLTVHAGPTLLWRDLDTGHLLKTVTLGQRGSEPAALSADGRLLAVAHNGFVEIWRVADGQRLRQMAFDPDNHFSKAPRLFRFSADGSRLITAVGGNLIAHDVNSGQFRVLRRQASPFLFVELVLGDQYVLTGETERVCCIDLISGLMTWSLKGYVDRERPVVLPGGRLAWLPTRARDGPGLFDLDTTLLAEPRPQASVGRWRYITPDGQRVCIGDIGGFMLCNCLTGEEAVPLPELYEPLGFTHDGRWLVGRDLHYCLQCWDTASGKPRYLAPPAPAHFDVTHLAFRLDGRTLISGCEDGGLFRRWDLATQQAQTLIQLPECTFLHSLTLLPDGRRLLHKDKGPTLTMWDLDEVRSVFSVSMPRPFGYQRLQMQPTADGRSLLAVYPVWDGGLTFGSELRDIETGALQSERLEADLGGSLAISADGTHFASSYSGVHEAATGLRRSRLPVEGATVRRLYFSPDGSRLVLLMQPAHAIDGGAALVETATGRLIHRLPVAATETAVFSPNGRLLVTASAEGLQVWDAFTGRELKCWKPNDLVRDPSRPQPAARSLAISPDGRTLASGHGDGTVLLWELPRASQGGGIPTDERNRLWADLASTETARSWKAMARLADSPADALVMLRERLRPTLPLTSQRLQALFNQLDDAAFGRREAAQRELDRHADLISPEAWSMLQPRSLEQAQRLNFCRQTVRTLFAPERVRRWRAITVLATIDTPTARKLLEQMADSPPTAAEGMAARSALRRLNTTPPR